MGEVIQFPGRRKRQRSRSTTLCKSGFHRWAVDKEQRFDVKQGRLVTIRRCERCGETSVTAD